MKKLIALSLLCFVSTTAGADPAKDAAATKAEVQKMFGFVPAFLDAMPDTALPGLWEESKGLLMGTETALGGKQKDLIALGVAAQIPCEYCIYMHTSFAKLEGASKAELGEAVAMAGLTRHWSTFLNGLLPDETKFRADIAKTMETMKLMMAGKAPPPKPIVVTDAKSAREDIAQTFGASAAIFLRFPAEGITGAWRMEKDLDLGETAVDAKTKALIGIAVAAQIPCRYCIIVDTEFAKLTGVTDREITEAIAVASLVREWSTLMNGLQIDKARFKSDVDQLVKRAAKPRVNASK